MIILQRPHTNPYFNLAAEEFLVKNSTKQLFMLWQNEPSVVVGKHQNALKEINVNYLLEQNIPLIRRISGGGTVYHDLGNLNYSFIDFGQRESLVNFKKYSAPILEVLQKMGVDARLEGKSDLKIDGKKFSGNASHVYKNTVLHHGTLLFSSELTALEKSIKANLNPFTDKAVASNRSKVTNILSHLKEPLSIEEFRKKIVAHIKHSFPSVVERGFTQDEIYEIEKLAEEKYRKASWNFGYSPQYVYKNTKQIAGVDYALALKVKNGKIEQLEVTPTIAEADFASIFLGAAHEPETINAIYQKHLSIFSRFHLSEVDIRTLFFG